MAAAQIQHTTTRHGRRRKKKSGDRRFLSLMVMTCSRRRRPACVCTCMCAPQTGLISSRLRQESHSVQCEGRLSTQYIIRISKVSRVHHLQLCNYSLPICFSFGIKSIHTIPVSHRSGLKIDIYKDKFILKELK